jgi:prepilin-type N-terminal cleavage/methylation domain-containing protein
MTRHAMTRHATIRRATTRRATIRPVTGRPGVTLVELMVALGLFSILLATTLNFYRHQGVAFTDGNSRMTVMQNLRYGVNALEQNLRTAGVGVPAKQPVLVYAGKDVIAFNADYGTNLANDFFAVYYDPRLPNGAVSALDPSRKFTLPRTTFTYPDSAYFLGSGNSPAETIIFYFEPDTTTARTDDYVLYRQVNDQKPETVARRLLKTSRDFFTYYVLDDTRSGSPVVEVPSSYLPGWHAVPIHGSPADTGQAAGVDSVRAVRVTFAATNGRPGSHESVREISRLIRLPNAGLATQPNCGNKPILGTSLLAVGRGPTQTVPGRIELTWAPATDEVSGEMDVLRYVIWRRTGDTGPWGDPLTSVSPGATSYLYRDFSAAEGVAYTYALAAQDCTPQFSAMATAGPVMWAPE